MAINRVRANVIDEDNSDMTRSAIDLAVPGGQASFVLLKHPATGKDLTMHLFCQDRSKN
jgi:hypothetical protein